MRPRAKTARVLAVALLLALLSSGCGAIHRETPIEVERTGSARVSVYENGELVYTGPPLRPLLDPSCDHDLEIRCEGHETAHLRLESHVNGSSVVLLVCECLVLPIIGLPILPLAIAGDAFEALEPESPRVTLKALDVASEQETQTPPAPANTAPSSTKQPASTPPTATQPVPPPQQAAPPPPSTEKPASAPSTEKPTSANRYCTSCGKPLKPGAAFCTECGAKQ